MYLDKKKEPKNIDGIREARERALRRREAKKEFKEILNLTIEIAADILNDWDVID